MKRVAMWVVLASLTAASVPTSAALARAAAAAPAASVDEVAEGLTCQCGCGLTVANCNHPNCSFSVPVREQIERMLKSGLSRERILDLFRAKYGEKVLSAPQAQGFNLLAWVTPFAALFLGASLILIALLRWRAKQSPPASAPTEPVLPYDPQLRYRLRREVERLG